MRLQNKVALITGGARMGVIVAQELANKGCDVALTYFSSKEPARAAQTKVLEKGRRSLIVQADLTKEKDVKKTIRAVTSSFGRLDILINMASVYEQTPWAMLNEKKWRLIMAANLTSVYLTVLHATPFLKKREGRVVNFSDWVAESSRPRYKHFLPYYVAKKGVLGITEAQALELAPRVLVNAIAPGPILPPAALSWAEKTAIKQTTPLQRWGGVLEIAKTVLFLCETDFITGECICIDGGRHLL